MQAQNTKRSQKVLRFSPNFDGLLIVNSGKAAFVVQATVPPLPGAAARKNCRLEYPSATKLIWIGSFIAPWTNWSVCRGSAAEKTYRLPSTSISGDGDDIFCQTKPRSALFSIDM